MHHPEFYFTTSQPLLESMSCCAIGLFEGEAQPCLDHLIHDPCYQQAIAPLIKESHFTGKLHTTATTHYQGGKLILVGLGKQATVTQEIIRQAASNVYRNCLALYSSTVTVCFSTLLKDKAYLKAFTEGILLTAHLDERFKSKKDTQATRLKEVAFLNALEDYAPIQLAQKITTAVCLARELANAPANYVTPTTLAKTAITLAEKYHLDLKILEKEDCVRLGMGAYLSVTQGSDAPPKFIHLCYKPKTSAKPAAKIALIGKGVTFDSGGLNLKIGAAKIESMKYDMAGAAAVLGVAEAIGAIKPNQEVHFIIAATENMVNGSATKPGDVVTASNGTTIEVDNTDAEGRLTLADALVYAEQLGVDKIVDLATLTGAVVTALGEQIAGIFGNDQPLVDGLKAAAASTGEKVWQMPLEEAYLEGMQSIVADMRNTGGKQGGGSITAALFLKHFLKKTPWAHVDIAGTAAGEKSRFYHHAGATGFGVRLLVEWILQQD